MEAARLLHPILRRRLLRLVTLLDRAVEEAEAAERLAAKLGVDADVATLLREARGRVEELLWGGEGSL